jgi:hypothetical protein
MGIALQYQNPVIGTQKREAKKQLPSEDILNAYLTVLTISSKALG